MKSLIDSDDGTLKKITPTAEHGPISWNGVIYEPGEAIVCPSYKAKRLIRNGKAEATDDVVVPPYPDKGVTDYEEGGEDGDNEEPKETD